MEETEVEMKETKVTVKIPRPLYRKIQIVIDDSGFSSPTDFIVFVLRDLVGEDKPHEVCVPAEGVGCCAEATIGQIENCDLSNEYGSCPGLRACRSNCAAVFASGIGRYSGLDQ